MDAISGSVFVFLMVACGSLFWYLCYQIALWIVKK